MSARSHIVLSLVAATAGLFFSSFSTFDFAQHLDRQVHDIHCSFVPGLAEVEQSAESGCQVTMMSPYSSLFRTAIWGGLPISLPGMAVFAFLLYRGVDLLGSRGQELRAAATVHLIAWVVPVIASVVMGIIAFVELDAACKLCIGTYASSAAGFLGALLAWAAVRRTPPPEGTTPLASTLFQGAVQLGIFVALPAAVYFMLAPDYSRYVGKCGTLLKPADPYDVMVSLDDNDRGIPAIEVFDPLCPACKAFEHRLSTSALGGGLARRAVLFPLDDECNWMVSSALHPGACAISEAMLCADEAGATSPRQVMQWAFQHQEQITEAARNNPQAAGKLAGQQFPELQQCIGSAGVRSKLNKSLRWAVTNRLPVLTPQLYVDGVKLCDEDTDLGMDFALSRMITLHKQGKLGDAQ